MHADVYVLATTPFAAADILERTPALAVQEQLRLFRPLTQGGPHTQVSFRIAFSEKIAWPRERTAVVVADSEFNLTLFAQEQAWAADMALGDGVKSLWTGTACVATVPGRLHGVRCLSQTQRWRWHHIKHRYGYVSAARLRRPRQLRAQVHDCTEAGRGGR